MPRALGALDHESDAMTEPRDYAGFRDGLLHAANLARFQASSSRSQTFLEFEAALRAEAQTARARANEAAGEAGVGVGGSRRSVQRLAG